MNSLAEAGDTTLILGGSGFLGVHLARLAAQVGRTWTAARTPPPPQCAVPCGHLTCDALAPGGVEQLIQTVRPARVALCTALSRAADCAAYPVLAGALNAELVGRVARACVGIGARFVHVSSDLVFGRLPAPIGGFGETDQPGPVNLYGTSKLAGEGQALAADPGCLVVRLPLLYGHSFGRALGASDALLAQVARGERPLLFGDEWRTPLEVSCAAQAIVEALHSELCGVLHVAGPERCNRYELGLQVLQAGGWSTDSARQALAVGRRADSGLDTTRPADVSLNCARAQRELRTPLVGLAQGLSRRPA